MIKQIDIEQLAELIAQTETVTSYESKSVTVSVVEEDGKRSVVISTPTESEHMVVSLS
ncbi:hypothetical protein KI655_18555 [Vibrio sp. D404a]|uniref:hypothetical protein n=1 Tax=unclassified Vibrio TaxID=2614977 RepID=UPI002554D76B|nr:MULTISPECIES: hypothetical protein [unclassified Vibrio]MDK9739300.1 hypothetical protein [Vibrio sp. D404a]MDK9797664.1 hypothetical protein [Vibrio sp. D449a]